MSTPLKLAIHYSPAAYSLQGKGHIMGRQSAGDGFLRALFEHGHHAEPYSCYTDKESSYLHFKQQFAAFGVKGNTDWIPISQPERLGEVDNLFVGDPNLGLHAWRRYSRDSCAYGLTGLTHTVCSQRVISALVELTYAPLEPWDTLICTSEPVRKVVRGHIATMDEYLRQRFGTEQTAFKPQTPVIPLGVDCRRFEKNRSPETVKTFRQKNAIPADAVVILYFGRLSIHAKAHPLAMYLALEQVARQTSKPLVLLLVGTAANERIHRAFRESAQRLCPSIRLVMIDGREPGIDSNAWQYADIFCSLSDNIQESFGLTPVEAMAAGLPVVATDWDGYRDTIVEGETGFRVPTIMPGPGNGEELAWRYLTRTDDYDRYVGQTSQCVAVDIQAAASSLLRLIENPELRLSMGENGRNRARLLYDWPVILEQYRELWTESKSRLLHAEPVKNTGAQGLIPTPQMPDPFTLFSAYPSEILTGDFILQALGSAPMRRYEQLSAMEINSLGQYILADDKITRELLACVMEAGYVSADELLAAYPAEQAAQILRTLSWLMKLGVLGGNPAAGHTAIS